jgi:hypothetical protein
MRRLLTHHSLAALFSGEPDGEKHRRRECRVATMQQYYTEAKERASTLMRGMEWKLQFHRSLLLADELLAMVVVLMSHDGRRLDDDDPSEDTLIYVCMY